MFALLSKLAEILTSCGLKILDGRRGARDVRVAGQLLRIAAVLQDVIAGGQRLLALAGSLAAGTADAAGEAEFGALLTGQVNALRRLQILLAGSRELLTTVDPGFFLDLVPFTDEKSGLLTRWAAQAARGQFSTTTLFFLPPESLQRVLDAGRALATADGMELDRIAYLNALADGLRTARSAEVRDIRGAGDGIMADEIAAARAELARARTLCQQLVAATERSVGAEAMAGLRRQLVLERQRN